MYLIRLRPLKLKIPGSIRTFNTQHCVLTSANKDEAYLEQDKETLLWNPLVAQDISEEEGKLMNINK